MGNVEFPGENKPEEVAQPKENRWKLINKFAEPLEKYERFSVFMFIMIVFFMIVGFVLGWVSCQLAHSLVW